ncbi:unnamed protein product [Paramecium sonneborni]|uniref:WD40-repeat-containing domain n=1 Tax=Paramecium sonneborni TaxID=65129 RepID=A0A8S1KWR6_9CILI|nr:unnamed protein product [Paramecium sonneborni]
MNLINSMVDVKEQYLIFLVQFQQLMIGKKNIWNFQNGKMELSKCLEGDDTKMNCYIFSKKQNAFICSDDSSIRIWKQQNDKEWIKSDRQTQHQNAILCLTLNEEEDILFAGGAEFIITIWKVDFNMNQLTYIQSLKRHTFSVFAQIILKINQFLVEQLWEFCYIVNQSINQDGSRIKFLDDNQFIWAANTQDSDKIHVFELDDGQFYENQEKTLQLIKDNKPYDIHFFPIIYNKQKNAIFFKHKSNLYILRKQENGELKIVEVFNFGGVQTQGNVTLNGDYLVEWNEYKQCFSTYEICYQ